MELQVCVNCNRGTPGYPHPADCPRPKYRGEPDEDSPLVHRPMILARCPCCGDDIRTPSEDRATDVRLFGCRLCRRPPAPADREHAGRARQRESKSNGLRMGGRP